jgi:hypothetical protein
MTTMNNTKTQFKIGPSQEQQAYDRYVKYCESIDVPPAPFDRWKMFEGYAGGESQFAFHSTGNKLGN